MPITKAPIATIAVPIPTLPTVPRDCSVLMVQVCRGRATGAASELPRWSSSKRTAPVVEQRGERPGGRAASDRPTGGRAASEASDQSRPPRRHTGGRAASDARWSSSERSERSVETTPHRTGGRQRATAPVVEQRAKRAISRDHPAADRWSSSERSPVVEQRAKRAISRDHPAATPVVEQRAKRAISRDHSAATPVVEQRAKRAISRDHARWSVRALVARLGSASRHRSARLRRP